MRLHTHICCKFILLLTHIPFQVMLLHKFPNPSVYVAKYNHSLSISVATYTYSLSIYVVHTLSFRVGLCGYMNSFPAKLFFYAHFNNLSIYFATYTSISSQFMWRRTPTTCKFKILHTLSFPVYFCCYIQFIPC